MLRLRLTQGRSQHAKIPLLQLCQPRPPRRRQSQRVFLSALKKCGCRSLLELRPGQVPRWPAAQALVRQLCRFRCHSITAIDTALRVFRRISPKRQLRIDGCVSYSPNNTEVRGADRTSLPRPRRAQKRHSLYRSRFLGFRVTRFAGKLRLPLAVRIIVYYMIRLTAIHTPAITLRACAAQSGKDARDIPASARTCANKTSHTY